MTITFRPIERILWDASIDAPEFSKLVPGLDMRAGLPSAASITPFDDADAVRPYRHLRAFYLKRADGVVAVKGSEIMAEDVDVHLGALADYRIEFPGRGRSLFSALGHFPLNEQKIPLALSLDEAMEDVRSAAAVQKAHLARFGTRAHVPLPLYAVRWPDSVAEAHLGRLNKLLSARARRTVERVAADGLGARALARRASAGIGARSGGSGLARAPVRDLRSHGDVGRMARSSGAAPRPGISAR
jgi:hypothetical protein